MDLLDSLAHRHDGLFDVTDAAAIGVGAAALNQAVRARRLIRLGRGWYSTPEQARGAEARHRLRTRAAIRGHRDAVATHHSALLAYGLPTHAANLDVVHVGSGSTKRTRCVRGLVLHRLPAMVPVREEASIPCVTPAVAIVQTGVLNGHRAGLVAADAALRQADPSVAAPSGGGTTREEIAAAVRLYRRAHGMVAVARTLELAEPSAESPGESLMRHDLWLLGVPVEAQVEIAVGTTTYRADFRISGTRILIEFDGLVKLDDPTQARRADERERALRRAGWIIVRFTWAELGRLRLIGQRLADAAQAHGQSWPVTRAA